MDPTAAFDPLSAALREWSGDERHSRARDEREQARWNAQLAAEEMRFTGVLLDLSERGTTVRITTAEGRSHSGAITAVGFDFCAMSVIGRAPLIVASAAITGVHVEEGAKGLGPASGRMTEPDAPTIAEALSAAAGERIRVRFVVRGSAEVRGGELHDVGADVLTIALDAPAGQTVFVPIAQLSEISVDQ